MPQGGPFWTLQGGVTPLWPPLWPPLCPPMALLAISSASTAITCNMLQLTSLGYPLKGEWKRLKGVHGTHSPLMQKAISFFVLGHKQLLCRSVLSNVAHKKLPNSPLCFRRQWRGRTSFLREERLRPAFRYLCINNTLVFKGTFENKVNIKLTKFSKLAKWWKFSKSQSATFNYTRFKLTLQTQ